MPRTYSPAHLFGRQTEVQKLVEALNTPGQHVLLYGERGVGKSSLANVAAELMSIVVKRKLFFKSCDRSDTLETILQRPLAAVGADLTRVACARSSGQRMWPIRRAPLLLPETEWELTS